MSWNACTDFNNDPHKGRRKVVCAAMRNCLGEIICGARHHDSIMNAQASISKHRRYWKTFVKLFGFIVWRCEPVEQGFIDQWDNFLTREEAFIVANASGQCHKTSGNLNSIELFSEDLY